MDVTCIKGQKLTCEGLRNWEIPWEKRSEVWALHMVVGLTCTWDLTHLHGLSETRKSTSIEAIGSILKTWLRGGGADAITPIHMSFCLIHKGHACHGESSKVEHNVWWLKESWNISNKKNSVYEADVVLSNKIERKKVKLMDVVQKLRKDTKMHLLLTPKQNKLQQRLSLVERGKACLKQLCWLILAQLKYQATFIDYYIN